MSFSSDVKEELCRIPRERSCCVASELAALVHTSANVGWMTGGKAGGRLFVNFSVESLPLGRTIYSLLKVKLHLQPAIHVVEHARFGGRKSCEVRVEGDEAKVLLMTVGAMEEHDPDWKVLRRHMPRPQLSRTCCRRAYLRGVFLGCGSMGAPEKSYQMELAAVDPVIRENVQRVLESADTYARWYERREKQVIYLKEADTIVSVLAMIGAHRAVTDLEAVRIKRQVRSSATRAANCDMHNTEKSMKASAQQLSDIERLEKAGVLSTLPEPLQEMARVRRAYPELSLDEIGIRCRPAVGKSGVNHRLRRLHEAAEQVRGTAADIS